MDWIIPIGSLVVGRWGLVDEVLCLFFCFGCLVWGSAFNWERKDANSWTVVGFGRINIILGRMGRRVGRSDGIGGFEGSFL